MRRAVVAPLLAAPKKQRGRPPAEIGSMLLNYATALFLKLGNWAAVIEQLKSAGFTPVPRNTLIRRVQQRKAELDVQDSDPCHY